MNPNSRKWARPIADAASELADKCLRYKQRAEAAEAKQGELVEALAFYASEEAWTPNGHWQIDADTKPVLQDRGQRARTALSLSEQS